MKVYMSKKDKFNQEISQGTSCRTCYFRLKQHIYISGPSFSLVPVRLCWSVCWQMLAFNLCLVAYNTI